MGPNAERLAGARECLRMTRGLRVAAAQHLAVPVDEVHASASLAGDPLVIVLGRIFIIVQPVLDLHASVRTGEEQCGHRSNIRRFQQLGNFTQMEAPA